jgi:hypothetical protein
MAKTYILRYQAASFDDNVFDTQQLSGIRGASLSYLYSGDLVEQTIKDQGLKNPTLYLGASQGAFLFNVATNEVARKVQEKVEAALRRGDERTGCHDHLAYVLGLVEGDDSKALAAAESLCNLKKLQEGSFQLPKDEKGATRPGSRRDPRPALPNESRSAAMKARVKFGQDQRQSFYERMSGRPKPEFDFTDELQEIVSDPEPYLPLSLHGKIAVFYADGDKFGQHFKDAAKLSLDTLREVSSDLRKKQEGLLGSILDWLGEHYKWGVTNPYFCEGKARFETLLWGGDENLFVMPSWLGLEFAKFFYEKNGGWKLSHNDKHWTFSSGLVICDHKTPIRQVKSVAKELAECNKGAGGSAIQIEIFESLSMPDVDFNSYRAKLYFRDEKPTKDELNRKFNEDSHQLSIPGEKLGKLIDKIARLKKQDGLPRSQLYKMLQKASKARAFQARSDNVDRELRKDFALWKERAGADTPIKERDLDVLRDMREDSAKPPAFSLSLGLVAMLWDYVRPLDLARTGENE